VCHSLQGPPPNKPSRELTTRTEPRQSRWSTIRLLGRSRQRPREPQDRNQHDAVGRKRSTFESHRPAPRSGFSRATGPGRGMVTIKTRIGQSALRGVGAARLDRPFQPGIPRQRDAVRAAATPSGDHLERPPAGREGGGRPGIGLRRERPSWRSEGIAVPAERHRGRSLQGSPVSRIPGHCLPCGKQWHTTVGKAGRQMSGAATVPLRRAENRGRGVVRAAESGYN
jgi:hypothetical protein